VARSLKAFTQKNLMCPACVMEDSASFFRRMTAVSLRKRQKISDVVSTILTALARRDSLFAPLSAPPPHGSHHRASVFYFAFRRNFAASRPAGSSLPPPPIEGFRVSLQELAEFFYRSRTEQIMRSASLSPSSSSPAREIWDLSSPPLFFENRTCPFSEIPSRPPQFFSFPFFPPRMRRSLPFSGPC